MSKYYKFLQDKERATPLYGISVADNPTVDGLQPPAHQILCADMYEWAADWLLGILEDTDCPQGPSNKYV